MEILEQQFPEPSILPAPCAMRFISLLIEEFADEWANKWMMHFRWYRAGSDCDSEAYSRKIAVEMKSGAAVGGEGLEEEVSSMAAFFKERMLGRGFTVGSNEVTAPVIERSYMDAIALLNTHLQARAFLLGGRPCMADFGLSGQLYQCFQDVTAGELMRLHAPYVALWAERMVSPCIEPGATFESWATLSDTLEPFLSTQVQMFLQWSDANARALSSKQKDMSIELRDAQVWKQSVGGPQKYHGKALKEIRHKYGKVNSDNQLCAVMQRCGCHTFLCDPSQASKL